MPNEKKERVGYKVQMFDREHQDWFTMDDFSTQSLVEANAHSRLVARDYSAKTRIIKRTVIEEICE